MNEFSDRPFALGSMFGVRSFRVDEAGLLTGVVRVVPWVAGTNEAVCIAPPYATMSRSLAAIASSGVSLAQTAWAWEALAAASSGRVFLKKRPRDRPTPPEPPHTIASLNCTCGFYAYFDTGHNPHHVGGNVLGIVEGFGVMTVGSRGFRASKARIRALILSPLDRVLDRRVVERYGVPVFDCLEDALAEFPLTVPEGTPQHETGGYTFAYQLIGKDAATSAFRRAAEAAAQAARRLQTTTDAFETRRARALRLRRERNTGPADPRGLDGRRRRG